MELGFSRQDEELEATELRLGLPGAERPQKPPPCGAPNAAKRALVDATEERSDTPKTNKSQVVGWPPVRSSFRRNVLESKKAEAPEKKQSTAPTTTTSASAHFIKVSMDGAPFLRKVDLNVLKGYKDLRLSLDAMFKCFDTTGSELSITYEDKDGDWMLVGDVPWDMFTESCRRLRIMKGSEAKGFNST